MSVSRLLAWRGPLAWTAAEPKQPWRHGPLSGEALSATRQHRWGRVGRPPAAVNPDDTPSSAYATDQPTVPGCGADAVSVDPGSWNSLRRFGRTGLLPPCAAESLAGTTPSMATAPGWSVNTYAFYLLRKSQPEHCPSLVHPRVPRRSPSDGHQARGVPGRVAIHLLRKHLDLGTFHGNTVYAASCCAARCAVCGARRPVGLRHAMPCPLARGAHGAAIDSPYRRKEQRAQYAVYTSRVARWIPYGLAPRIPIIPPPWRGGCCTDPLPQSSSRCGGARPDRTPAPRTLAGAHGWAAVGGPPPAAG